MNFSVLSLFCGLGGLTKGILDGRARHAGADDGRFELLAAIDADPATVAAHDAYTGRKDGVCLDLFSRAQYEAYHGAAPPKGWREVTVEDIRQVCGGRAPDLVATSPPCKGFSGLLPEKSAKRAKYQALNELVFRGIWLVLEAFPDDPPGFFWLENVPRALSRGRAFLEELAALLRSYGYSVNLDEEPLGGVYCCGELGGLAQRRRRYLMLARHRKKVPPYLFRPPTQPLKTVGEVLGALPLPGDPRGGILHQPKRTAFRTALRLALIPPGGDWRDLRELAVKDGVLRDWALAPTSAYHGGVYGVIPWGSPAGTVTGRSTPTNGAFSVADPRPSWRAEYGQLGVLPWDGKSGAVTAGTDPGQGRWSIADPRGDWMAKADTNHYRRFGVVPWDGVASSVTSGGSSTNGRFSIADPRVDWHPSSYATKLRVVPWGGPGPTVTTTVDVGAGALAIADPRQPWMRAKRDVNYGGHYGIVPWDDSAEVGVWVIRSPHDGAWHRPMTTLELMALQGLIVPEDLDGPRDHGPAWALDCVASDTQMRQWIGNAVPPPAAKAIAETILISLLAAEAGETWMLSSTSAWCRRAAALCTQDYAAPGEL